MYVSAGARFKIPALYLYITEMKFIIAVKGHFCCCTAITEVSRHYCFLKCIVAVRSLYSTHIIAINTSFLQ
jgi:hypothetical protein